MLLKIVKIRSSICQKFMKTPIHVQPNSGKITPKNGKITYKIISGGYQDDPACPKDHKCQEGSCSTAEPDPGLSYYCICGNGVGGQFCDKRVYFKISSTECGKMPYARTRRKLNSKKQQILYQKPVANIHNKISALPRGP